jgi:hypothetical protein
MPKSEKPPLPGDIQWVPKAWPQALAEFLGELTLLARAAREALERDLKEKR